MAEDKQTPKSGSPSLKWTVASVLISLFALILSGYTIYKQLWPRDTTKATLTRSELSAIENTPHKEWGITIAVSFVNTGNRPTILEALKISARSRNHSFDYQSCDYNPGDDWITMPWQTTLSHGEEPSSALPRVVNAGSAISSVYSFRGFPYKIDDGFYISKFFCIKYEMIDADGNRVDKKHPIGIYDFDSNRIKSFEANQNINALITIVP